MKLRSRTLTVEDVMRAGVLYRELDERGKRKYSVEALAEIFAVGETTMYRAVTRTGPYRSVPEGRTEGELEIAAQESLKRFQEKFLAERSEMTEGETKADRLLEELEVSEGARERAKRLLGED